MSKNGNLDWFLGLKEKSYLAYIKLRVGGKDEYSMMSKEELESKCSQEDLYMIKCKLAAGDYDNALRWYLRGLTLEEAVKKAEIDAIVRISKHVVDFRQR